MLVKVPAGVSTGGAMRNARKDRSGMGREAMLAPTELPGTSAETRRVLPFSIPRLSTKYQPFDALACSVATVCRLEF